MDALILSCGTGGGHNAAGKAVAEELKKRGHRVKCMDPYKLVSDRLAKTVGGAYIKTAQRLPALFGFVYLLGEGYRRLPFRSPVYYANKELAIRLSHYLEENPVDVIIMPHLFPAEILTYMKKHGQHVPKTVFIATDYTCIPFTEETECDYYIIPDKEQLAEFARWGIPKEKLIPIGIPVDASFEQAVSRQEAKEMLGFLPEKHYILVAGGSIGAGSLERVVDRIGNYLNSLEDAECVVVCGNNSHLYNRLNKKWGGDYRLHLLKKTSQMALYLKACDVYLSKPGGLSSTEAAVSGVPLVHISPIPGCEIKNQQFFSRHFMCVPVRQIEKKLVKAIEYVEDSSVREKMLQAQKLHINRHAREDICDWLECIIKNT